ncbi:MAG: hypothetical protein VKM98_07015 [Cyanobacteriota bacterium]|nr:hypothetical protein [Cyanobacteriota bacterium]
MPPSSPHSETAEQLEQLRQRVAQGNPELYRHWALYLQVLREGLGSAVERACFYLAVEVHPQRYRALDGDRRLALHRRIAALVQRSCSLLTVEQLQALAQQMQRREQRQLLRARRQWLEALHNERDEGPHPQGQGLSPPEEAPQGSVHLGLALPINGQLFGLQSPQADADPGAESRSQAPRPERPEADGSEPSAQDLMAVFSRLIEDSAARDADAADQPQEEGLLPTDPTLLLAWFERLEAALERRLRNLSHALNVELVRLGLSISLLPLRLLEAVASGQVDSQAAPANLVRLAVPVPEPMGDGLLDTQSLLLRPSDLEADQLRLRTCRSRLQQARAELRRMAQTYQRLERRLQAHEAEQLWLNDHSTAQTPRSRPPA